MSLSRRRTVGNKPRTTYRPNPFPCLYWKASDRKPTIQLEKMVLFCGEKTAILCGSWIFGFQAIIMLCSWGNNCSTPTMQKQQFFFLVYIQMPRSTRRFLYILSYSVCNFIKVQIRQSCNCSNVVSEMSYCLPTNAGIQSCHCRLHSPLIASK